MSEPHDPTKKIHLGSRINDEPFFLPHKERARHTYLIGQTGTGKTSLLNNMILQDLAAGHGLCVIDPHGDLANDILDNVPPSRGDHLVYINPGDLERPIGFNPLHNVPQEARALIADGVVSAFKNIWPDSWGARLENLLLMTIHALLDIPGSSLLWLPRFLNDDQFRALHVNKITNPLVKDFFLHDYNTWTKRYKNEAIAPVLNKIGRVLVDPALRNMLCQQKSTFDLRYMMDNQRILIVNLSKGGMGEGSAHLLGALLITSIAQAAMSRVDLPLEERKPFYLYCDEFQNFITGSFNIILSEARKYALCLTLAHQFLDQLPHDLRSAVFGNVSSFIGFRLGANDSPLMAKQFGIVREDVFQDLPNFEAWASILIDGVPASAFPFSPSEPIVGFFGRGARLAKNSAVRFGQDRVKIEDKVKVFFRL